MAVRQERPPISASAVWVIFCGLIVVIGSCSTWATVHAGVIAISVDGTSGEHDGWFTLLCGGVALIFGILCTSRPRRGWAAVSATLFVLGAAISGYDLATLPNPIPALATVTAGFGIWMCVLGSIAGLIAACAGMAPRPPPMTLVAPPPTWQASVPGRSGVPTPPRPDQWVAAPPWAGPPGPWAGPPRPWAGSPDAWTIPPGTPPNWLQDPSGRHEWRYYDGAAWTDWVSDAGVPRRAGDIAPR